MGNIPNSEKAPPVTSAAVAAVAAGADCVRSSGRKRIRAVLLTVLAAVLFLAGCGEKDLPAAAEMLPRISSAAAEDTESAEAAEGEISAAAGLTGPAAEGENVLEVSNDGPGGSPAAEGENVLEVSNDGPGGSPAAEGENVLEVSNDGPGASPEAAGENVLEVSNDGPGASPAAAGDTVLEVSNDGPGAAGSDLFAGRNDLQKQEDGTWLYQGERYKRNRYVKAILCMGIDRSDALKESRKSAWGGQADAIFLIAQDTSDNTIRVLMLPRDTITEIRVISEDGTVSGMEWSHLNYAFAYGDGRYRSAENEVAAVSELLGDLEIDHYIAGDMSLLETVNDAVGGVDVIVPTEELEKCDPRWKKGEQVHLEGKEAEKFIRYRDTEKDATPLYRMSQHQAYLTGFQEAFSEKMKKNSNTVNELYDIMAENLLTDLQKGELLKIGTDAAMDDSFGESSILSPGGTVITDVYDEFYVNYSELNRMVLDLFYRKAG